MKKLLSEVMGTIRPEEKYEQDIRKRIGDIVQKLKKSIKHAKIELGGSGAKGTWLRTFDADIFVKFNYAKFRGKSDALSDILEKPIKKLFQKASRLHGSRDYFQIRQGSFTFEIIPILDIKKAEEAMNITDVSPLHTKFVLQHRKLANEMRLTKQFCKAAKVYGAESYIRGFSGYVCEILTAYYGSFASLMRNAAKWKENEVIDIKGFYKGKDVFMELNKSKLVSPLVVIDPVQKDRNAAAALSMEKFCIFRQRCSDFLKKPSADFFNIESIDKIFLKKKFSGKNLIMLSASPLRRKEDIAGAKMLKAFEHLSSEFEQGGFKAIENGWEWKPGKEGIMFFVFESKPLGSHREAEGPKIKMKMHAEAFRKKHKNVFEKDGRLYANIKRKFTRPEELVKPALKSQCIIENVSSIRKVS
ncbi:CCA tRNA nucleotidyltransferase [Candidatus Woesearchaeota archaeon]|nr:CCA tRNA nucleotidyltransferase [Candidatus Woesearchaeota archaeon]